MIFSGEISVSPRVATISIPARTIFGTFSTIAVTRLSTNSGTYFINSGIELIIPCASPTIIASDASTRVPKVFGFVNVSTILTIIPTTAGTSSGRLSAKNSAIVLIISSADSTKSGKPSIIPVTIAPITSAPTVKIFGKFSLKVSSTAPIISPIFPEISGIFSTIAPPIFTTTSPADTKSSGRASASPATRTPIISTAVVASKGKLSAIPFAKKATISAIFREISSAFSRIPSAIEMTISIPVEISLGVLVFNNSKIFDKISGKIFIKFVEFAEIPLIKEVNIFTPTSTNMGKLFNRTC